jgi:hypothetical protein
MNHSRNLAEEKESPEGFLLKLFTILEELIIIKIKIQQFNTK